ncbi:MAG TPA: hypothetical protein VKB96_07255 [Gammaproteobacteria bacterium]|nr:hypothetical protein [Gammaproteobacteria bacterium]
MRKRLLRLNEALVAAAIRSAGVRRLTVDVDGSVISTGFYAEGARVSNATGAKCQAIARSAPMRHSWAISAGEKPPRELQAGP